MEGESWQEQAGFEKTFQVEDYLKNDYNRTEIAFLRLEISR